MASSAIIIQPLIPRTRILRADKYQSAIKDALIEEAGIQERMYMRVGRGFSDPPEFKTKLLRGSFGVTAIELSTNSEPFIYIDQGTKERWAVMSDDFRPRTTKRTLGIKGKQGQAVIRGKSAMMARGIAVRPGIEAREYTQEIAERRQKPFAKKMQAAINKAARSGR